MAGFVVNAEEEGVGTKNPSDMRGSHEITDLLPDDEKARPYAALLAGRSRISIANESDEFLKLRTYVH